jgi:2-polyprenyl-3-methyl-5-hydroxy-6-metoxy-1,4-benzoquinol methylase
MYLEKKKFEKSKLELYCRHENYKELFTTSTYDLNYEFRKCTKCELIFHFPFFDSKEIADHYTNYGIYSDKKYIKKELKRREAPYKKIGHELLALSKKENLNKRVLDVGCSNGILLHHLQKMGFDVFGVEVDPHSSKMAKNIVGDDKIFTGFLSDSPYLDQTFDFVISEQTIEHVENPFKMLLDIKYALKNKGVLRLSTPSFGGPSFKLLKDNWKNVCPNDHISMFSVRSLKMYLKGAGFSKTTIISGGFLWNARRNGDREYARYSSPVMGFLFKVIGKILKYLNKGDGLLAYAQKAER